jgi:drug/metabolite transporter (DMT)-like permease
MATPAKSRFIAAAPALFVVLWATGFVVSRLSAGHVGPLWFLTLRFPIAGLFMLGVALQQHAPWPNAKLAAHAIAAGAFLHGLYLGPIYWAVAQGLPAGVAALIVGLQPLLTAFLAAFILGEVINLRHWLGLGVGLLGIGLVVWPKLIFAHVGGITPVTAGLALSGAVAISFGTVYQKRFATRLHLASGGFWQYVGATLIVLLGTVALGDYQFDGSVQAWSALAWAVLVLSIGAITLLMMLIREGEISHVSSLIFLVPAVSALMTYLMFDEKLNLVQITGMAVCAAAVLIVNRSTPRKIESRHHQNNRNELQADAPAHEHL